MKDYYDGVTEDTAEVLRKLNIYVKTAYENGDVAYMDKPGEVTIKVRISKKPKEDK